MERATDLPVAVPGPVWAFPALALFAGFAIVPLLVAAGLSLTEWNGLDSPRFIGFDNWIEMTTDPRIRASATITLILLAGNLIFQLPLAILVGVWTAGFQRWRAVISALLFVPLVLSITATSIVWRQLFDPNFGIPALIGSWFGGDGNFIGTPHGAAIALVLVGSWGAVPFLALLFQGGARAIPEVLYDAAEMDGAGRIRRFFYVTLPQLRSSIIVATVFVVVGSLTAFDLVLILTRGGPGTATSTLPFTMYTNAFAANRYGYGSAIAIVLCALASLVSIALVRFSGYDRMESAQEGV